MCFCESPHIVLEEHCQMRFTPFLFGLTVQAASPAEVADMLPTVKGLLTNLEYVSNARKNIWSDAQLLSVLSANVIVDQEVSKILKSASSVEESVVFVASDASAEEVEISITDAASTTEGADLATTTSSPEVVDIPPTLPTLSASSPLARAGKGLACIITQLEDKYLASNLVRGDRQAMGLEAFLETVAVPLYMTLTDAEFKSGLVAERGEAETLWFNLMQQISYRAVVLHASGNAPEINLGEAHRRFAVVAKFVLQTLISMPGQSEALAAVSPDIPLPGGLPPIPGEVVDTCCELFWACMVQCIRRNMPTTSTTTTTPIPTEDPAILAKRKVELTKYIQNVNVKIDSLQQLIAKVKVSHAAGTDSDEFKAAMDAVRLGALQCYTDILTGSMLNDYLKLDLAPTKARFVAISDAVGPAFDVSQYDSVIATLDESPALLRAELLEVARAQM